MPQRQYQSPGITMDELVSVPPSNLRNGVPVFVGLVRKQETDLHQSGVSLRPLPSAGLWVVSAYAGQYILAPLPGAQAASPTLLTLPTQFQARFGAVAPYGYLARAVRGFFENDGRLCYAQVLCFDAPRTAVDALAAALDTIAGFEMIDLVCAPDVMRSFTDDGRIDAAAIDAMQEMIVARCDTRGDRFAILDSRPGIDPQTAIEQRRSTPGHHGALYYPWVRVLGDGPAPPELIPPCGHVAGIYARVDDRVGVHKAPANELLNGVLDLETRVTVSQQESLSRERVNMLLAKPGRGIRVWGDWTVSGDPAWSLISVRRVFIAVRRWLARNLVDISFEPNDSRLWARIGRELTAFLTGLYRRGALQGQTPQEAFYVKCDAETNPPEVRAAGMVVTEIGLAPSFPNEFIVVRITQTLESSDISGPGGSI